MVNPRIHEWRIDDPNRWWLATRGDLDEHPDLPLADLPKGREPLSDSEWVEVARVLRDASKSLEARWRTAESSASPVVVKVDVASLGINALPVIEEWSQSHRDARGRPYGYPWTKRFGQGRHRFKEIWRVAPTARIPMYLPIFDDVDRATAEAPEFLPSIRMEIEDAITKTPRKVSDRCPRLLPALRSTLGAIDRSLVTGR